MTVFWPRADSDPDDAESMYEEEGQGRFVRHFTAGADIYGFSGDHVHGDDDDFQGLSLREKFFIGDVPPAAPCHGGTGTFAKLKLRFEVLECTCHSMFLANEIFDLLITSSDYPEYDNKIVSMVGFADVGINQWGGGIEYPIFKQTNFLFSCIPTEGRPTAVMQFDDFVQFGGPHIKDGITGTPTIFTCKPLLYDAVAEVNEPGPTGKFVRFRIFGKLRFAMKLKLRFDVFDPRPPVEVVEKKLKIGFVVKNPIALPAMLAMAIRFESYDPSE